jgi:hypothetical protein
MIDLDDAIDRNSSPIYSGVMVGGAIMQVSIPLEKMTTLEKLRVIEEIWEDLRHAAQEIPSPAWHADVLHARELRVRTRKSRFRDWTEAKARIRRRVR